MEYDGWRLCEDLKPKLRCLRLFQYEGGKYNLEYHFHVPKQKISTENVRQFMQALVFRYTGGTGMNAEHILHHLVNDRAGEPKRENTFMWHKSDPEPGVIRFYCGSNTKVVWDEIISPDKFRTASRT